VAGAVEMAELAAMPESQAKSVQRLEHQQPAVLAEGAAEQQLAEEVQQPELAEALVLESVEVLKVLAAEVVQQRPQAAVALPVVAI